MTLRAIHAIFECDGCGCEIGTEIDTAATRPLRWSLYDIANDALRGGSGWVLHRRDREVGCVSFQRNKHLCPACTKEEDNKHLLSCHNVECEGCKPPSDNDDDFDDREHTIARAVAAHTVEKFGLRRSDETVAEYCLRAGIPMKRPMPKSVDEESVA